MRTRHIEVLVFDGCPSVDIVLDRVRGAIASANVPADVRLVRVQGEADAKRLRFLGSPTVRVDGVDIDRVAEHGDDFGLRCRVYSVGGRLEGAPPIDWITSALRGETIQRATSHISVDCCARGVVNDDE